jgi:hypothetical protein
VLRAGGVLASDTSLLPSQGVVFVLRE